MKNNPSMILYFLSYKSLFRNDEVIWPSDQVKKCGEALTGRNDCQ